MVLVPPTYRTDPSTTIRYVYVPYRQFVELDMRMKFAYCQPEERWLRLFQTDPHECFWIVTRSLLWSTSGPEQEM